MSDNYVYPKEIDRNKIKTGFKIPEELTSVNNLGKI